MKKIWIYKLLLQFSCLNTIYQKKINYMCKIHIKHCELTGFYIEQLTHLNNSEYALLW